METDAIMDLLRRTADEVIRPRFRALADADIEEKARPGDLVTVADREAETFLTALLQERHPDAVVVGEEGVFLNTATLAGLHNADHAFIIDPIDGTGNFARGDERYGVMLAETRGGITTRGWIWQPEFDRGYAVERGNGVELNGSPIERPRHNRPPLGAAGRKKLVGFDADGQLSPAVRTQFACAFDYPSILHGDTDFVFYTSLNPWDHLAGSLMVVEQGGVSRTLDGMAYNLLNRSRGLLVANDTLSWMAAQQYWPTH